MKRFLELSDSVKIHKTHSRYTQSTTCKLSSAEIPQMKINSSKKQKHGYQFLMLDQTKLSRVPLKIGHSHLCMRRSLELTLTVPLRIPYNQ